MKASSPQFQELTRPPAGRTSQQRKKRGDRKDYVVNSFLPARYHENASLLYTFREVLVLLPLLAVPGAVNMKPPSPVHD